MPATFRFRSFCCGSRARRGGQACSSCQPVPLTPLGPSTCASVIDTHRVLFIEEAWNTFGDLGAAIRATNRKAAEARDLAATIDDGPPYRVAVVWVVRASAANRNLVRRYPAIFANAFPASSQAFVDALSGVGNPPEQTGLVWYDAGRRRIHAWRRTGAMIDYPPLCHEPGAGQVLPCRAQAQRQAAVSSAGRVGARAKRGLHARHGRSPTRPAATSSRVSLVSGAQSSAPGSSPQVPGRPRCLAEGAPLVLDRVVDADLREVETDLVERQRTLPRRTRIRPASNEVTRTSVEPDLVEVSPSPVGPANRQRRAP